MPTKGRDSNHVLGSKCAPSSRRGSATAAGTKRKSSDNGKAVSKAVRGGVNADAATVAHRASSKGTPKGTSKGVAKGTPQSTSQRPFAGFRINRPVQANVNYDIWHEIMRHAVPRVLLSLRQVSRSLRHDLRDDSPLWMQSRVNAYGDVAPACPDHMTEREYCNLLEGFGCQKLGCPDRRPRKAYWILSKRMCDAHFNSSVRKHRSLSNLAHNNFDVRRLLNCLPACTVDTWGKYGGIAESGTPYDRKAYEIAIFQKYYAELQEMRTSNVSDSVKNAWFESLRTQMDKKTSQLREHEQFYKSIKSAKKEGNTQVRLAREKFFKEKAKEMDPPLEEAALVKVDAYKSSIKTGRTPTEACWQALRPKVEIQRVRAEKMIADDRAAQEEQRDLSGDFDDDLPQSRDSRRSVTSFASGGPPTERLLLGQFVENVLADLALDDLCPADIVAETLIRAHELYEASEDPRKGPLFMADTEWVLIEKLEPHLAARAAQAGRPLHETAISELARFRCPGCPPKPRAAERTWSRLLDHLADVHAPSTQGDFARLRGPVTDHHLSPSPRLALRTKPWPRNLPLLGRAQSSDGRWDLDTAPAYQVAAPPAPPAADVDPFDGRTVNMTAPIAGFVQDVMDTLAALAPSRLANAHRSRLAFEYAARRYAAGQTDPNDPLVSDGSGLDLSVMSSLHERLVLAGMHTMFAGLPCGHCFEMRGGGKGGTSGEGGSRPMRGGRGAPRGMELGLLIEHYDLQYCHAHAAWMQKLICWPEGRELLAALEEDPLAKGMFEELFPRPGESGPIDPAL